MNLSDREQECLNNSTVLIVDDIPRNIELLGSILSNAGFKIAVATSGTQAISAALANPPDIILMDINMPEMDGYEACEKLKRNDRTKDIPLIFLTARVSEEDIIKGFKTGGVDYVTKPFRIQELIARVCTHIEVKKSREKLLAYSVELKEAYEHLLKSEENLKEANATKDRFFSIISHDLRGPLSSLSKGMDMLLEKDYSLDEENKKTVITSMDQVIKKLFALLENLLEWSRSQRGLMEFSPSLQKIEPYIDEVLQLFGLSAEEKNISLKAEINPSLEAFFDRNMLKVILRNLISNAVKFTDENGLIEISAVFSGSFLKVSVTNNGAGLDQESIKNLFEIEKFHKKMGKHQNQGSGLGLILCKDFAVKMGGKIWVESTPGEKTTFSFTLPRND